MPYCSELAPQLLSVVIYRISSESIPRLYGITRIDWKSTLGLDVVYKPSSFLSKEY
jgi:hypothetical protein